MTHLPIFRGALRLDVSEAPLYPESRILESQRPAHRDAPARSAALINRCQTSSGGDYYVFLGAEFAPDSHDRLLIRLYDPEEMPDTLTESLLADLVSADPPRGVFTIRRGRFHLVDTREREVRLAVLQLFDLLLQPHAWPPSPEMLARLSEEWSTRKRTRNL